MLNVCVHIRNRDRSVCLTVAILCDTGGDHYKSTGCRSPLLRSEDRPQARRHRSHKALLLPWAMHSNRCGGKDRPCSVRVQHVLKINTLLFFLNVKKYPNLCWRCRRRVHVLILVFIDSIYLNLMTFITMNANNKYLNN